MSVRRVGLSLAGERREEVERRAGRKTAFPERKDMIVCANLQAARLAKRRMSKPVNDYCTAFSGSRISTAVSGGPLTPVV